MFTRVTTTGPGADDLPEGAQTLTFDANGTALIEDTVGGDDPRDFYRLTLDQPGPLQLQLEGAGGNVDLYVYDAQGNLLGSSTNGTGELDGLEGELPAGDYFVLVEPADGTPASYRLGVQAPGVTGPVRPTDPIRPEVDPGHTLDTAMALPLQPGQPLVVQDSVGGAGDPADLYRFDLTEGQPVSIALQGDQADVDLLLLDADGNVIAQSVNGGLEVDNLEGELPAGTYYVAVVPDEGAATTYSVAIQTGTVGPVGPIRPEVDPGHTLDTAMALPLQPGQPLVVQDSVGGAGDPADVYRFELTEGQPVSIALQGDQADVDLLLLDDQGNVIARSVNAGLETDSLEGELPAGTYYVAVVPYEGATTTYSIAIEAGTSTAVVDPPRPGVDAGHTLDTATALPVQPGQPLVVQDTVGGGQDPADVYRVDLASDQPIRIALQGDQGDVDLLLLDEQGNLIAQSVNGGLEVDSLEGGLPAGTYYVAVVPYQDVATGYTLAVETGATDPGVPGATPAAMPESLALRDSTGLGVGGASSPPFGGGEDKTFAGQLLAAGA